MREWIDPNAVDLAFFFILFMGSLEPVWFWVAVRRRPERPRPQIICPALLASVGICVCIAGLVVIPALLLANVDPHHRLLVAAPMRRMQGIAMFVALLSHWLWRSRLIGK